MSPFGEARTNSNRLFKKILPTKIAISAFLLIGIGVLVPMALIFILYSQNFKRTQAESERQDFRNLSAIVSKSLSKPLWDLSKESSAPIVSSIFSDLRAISVVVTESNGKLFYSVEKLEREEGESETLVTPVIYNNHEVGKVTIRFSLAQGNKLAANVILDGIRQTLLTFAICWVLIFFILNVKILRPLRRLKIQAELLAENILDVPFDWKQTDEIGELGRALESTRQSLEHSFEGINRLNGSLTAMNANLEEEINKRTMQLSNAVKLASIGEMAGSMAHEINNPLAVIQGQIELMSMDSTNNPEARSKRIDQIQRMVNRIVLIIRGLRNISRESKGDPMTHSSIGELITETIALCGARFKNHQIQLQLVNLPEAYFAWTQPTQVSQVLLNLLNNAHDAVEGTTDAWVKLEFIGSDHFYEISVMDSGPGIPLEIQHKIMDPFFTTKPIGKGTGLGLSVSRGIIESVGGEFFLDRSSVNTRFVMRMQRDPRSKLSGVTEKKKMTG